MAVRANWQADVRAAAGGWDPTLRLALSVRSRHMRSACVSRVCTMSSRPGIRSKPEDNESVADSPAFLPGCYGHHAALACDGETARRLLRAGVFEITFLDEYLPDMKGSAVAGSLRETPVRSAAFLVSMTGDAHSQGDIARRFDVCLQKPFSCEALMRNRYVLACRHRHRAGYPSSQAGQHQTAMFGVRGRDADYQTCRRNDAVVCARHRSA